MHPIACRKQQARPMHDRSFGWGRSVPLPEGRPRHKARVEAAEGSAPQYVIPMHVSRFQSMTLRYRYAELELRRRYVSSLAAPTRHVYAAVSHICACLYCNVLCSGYVRPRFCFYVRLSSPMVRAPHTPACASRTVLWDTSPLQY